MKKLLLLLLAVTAFAACDDDEQIRFASSNTALENGSLTGTNMIFYGRAVATAADGSVYTNKAARFEFAGGGEDFALYMHQMRFTAALPALEMRLYTIPYTPGQGAALTFSAESAVPEVLLPNQTGGGHSYQPAPDYPLTQIEGSIDDILCHVSFSCDVSQKGLYRVEYEGKLLEK